MSPSSPQTIPFPKGWSRHVRTAIVHAVSMANVGFAVARARAANHFDVRIRLQAELDQRDREISLLREELRIKDARMERILAQRRPHYPPSERLAILPLRAARFWSRAETARRVPRQDSIRIKNDRFVRSGSYRESRPSASLTPFPHPFIVVRCSPESPSSSVGSNVSERRGLTF